MKQLMDHEYVYQAGDLYWLSSKGLQLWRLLSGVDDGNEPANRPVVRSARVIFVSISFSS